MTRPDIVIIGSGVGGGAMALSLAPTGARILILERGPRLASDPQSSDADTFAEAVFVDRRYHSGERWQDRTVRTFSPGQFYFVGGHSKFYGTAMFRFRERDFDRVKMEDGVSPAWPISYADLEPYYAEAEGLFGVHGSAGADPTEPGRSGAFPHASISHEPMIGLLAERLAELGLHPFPMPAAIDRHEGGHYVRCPTCDAFPCRFGAKGDAETSLINRALAYPNVTLWPEAQVTRLQSDDRGVEITAADVERHGQTLHIKAPLFVLSTGAINSALLLLRSANGHHPKGLANSSDCVGRHLMIHHLTGPMAIAPGRVNDTRFPKTLSLNDFYFGAPDDPHPLGNLQMLGKIREPMVRASHPYTPHLLKRWLTRHSVDWLVMSEDLPDPVSRMRPLPNNRTEVVWTGRNLEAHRRFVTRSKKLRRRIGFHAVLAHPFGTERPSHQCGTVRMGEDPATSALDPWCRSWDHPNLYVVDASCFPSSAAVNPALTVAAQALRVGAHLRKELRGSQSEPDAIATLSETH